MDYFYGFYDLNTQDTDILFGELKLVFLKDLVKTLFILWHDKVVPCFIILVRLLL